MLGTYILSGTHGYGYRVAKFERKKVIFLSWPLYYDFLECISTIESLDRLLGKRANS